MPYPFCLPEEAKIVQALAPAADAGGRNGDWISLKNAHKLTVVCSLDQGHAAQVTFTLEQAKDVAGTGAKVLSGDAKVWANEDTAAGDALAPRADAKEFQTSTALKKKLVVFELDPAVALDLAGDFDCVRVKTGASNAANITGATYYLLGLRYAQATPPSAVVD